MNFPPMKYSRGEKVKFRFNNKGPVLTGVIEFADFGGAFEHDYHSYDIYVKEDNTLYKHVPEDDIFT
jgi:hypothetical protein